MGRHKPFGKGFKRGEPNRDPLRRVLRHEGGLDVLECGHGITTRWDFIGPVYGAKRRRCPECAKATPPPDESGGGGNGGNRGVD